MPQYRVYFEVPVKKQDIVEAPNKDKAIAYVKHRYSASYPRAMNFKAIREKNW